MSISNQTPNQPPVAQSQPMISRPITTAPTSPATPVAPVSPIQSLVTVMQSVKTNTPQANLNATSISDGNGGRIEFNEDGKGTKPIK